jgi:hypothetical protein
MEGAPAARHAAQARPADAPRARGLTRAVEQRRRGRARNTALDVLLAPLDLQLCYSDPVAIDRARLDLWARQVRVDAAAGNPAAASGDVAVLEWIRDHVAHALDRVDLTRLDARLEELRANVGDADLAAAARSATAFRRALAAAGSNA